MQLSRTQVKPIRGVFDAVTKSWTRLLSIKKGTFYRFSRMWHAYLSAAAFIVLIFFSFSGILLNHPEWLNSGKVATPAPVTVNLSLKTLEETLAGDLPGPALARIIEDEARVIGAFKAADISKFDVTLRYTGVKGDTLVFIDRETGLAEIEVEPASLASIIHNLHRGKEAGAVWKAIIDISAVIILAMSLVGFVLFLSLRLRLATSMKVIAGSVVGLGLIIWLLTP